jgi:hypothetical protein
MTAGELGIDVGDKWAREWRSKRIALVGAEPMDPVAMVTETGEVPEAVQELMRRAGLGAHVKPDREEDFWTGFVAGACAWAAEQAQTAQLGMGQN